MPIAGIIWIIAVVAFIILEAATYQMVSVWFIAGSICALLTSLMGGGFRVQMTVFMAVSIVLLIIVRPMAMKRLDARKTKTNADRLIGEKVLITEGVDNINGKGQGKLEGLVWSVRSESGKKIPEGTVLEVKRIEGVKIIVE